MSLKRRSAQRRDGRKISLGKMEHPTGTVTSSRLPVRKLSQYMRADDAPVPGIQYSMTLSSSSSLDKMFSGWPLQSVHAQNFSTIHAHWAAGESTSPYPSVCGRVDCCFE